MDFFINFINTKLVFNLIFKVTKHLDFEDKK